MKNVDFYDVRVVNATTTSILIDNGNVEEISVNYTRGGGIRALCGGSWGFTSADGYFDEKKALNTASELASSMNSRSPKEKVNLTPIRKPILKDLPRIKIDPRDISIEEKVKILKEMSKRAKLEGISSTSVIYSESEIKVSYTNIDGIDCEYELTRSGFAVTAVASENGVYQAGRKSKFGVKGYEIFDEADALELATIAAHDALELIHAKPAKGGSMPVILDQELAGVFVHEAVGHASEADLVLEGSSILDNMIGQQIASPLINIVDDPTLHEYGYFPFDDEGTQSQRTTIIKDGILTSFLHSRETSAKLGGEPGHCRCQGYSMPIVRMSNTYLENGDSTFEEMLEDIDNGMYLIGSRGGQVNTGEGIFQFNAEKAYLIEKGEITTLMRDVSLSGKTLEILNNVTHVGNDLKMNSGRCGKGGQLVPVSDGSPHISISKAVVGGA
ncbi:MAG: TldD/PmbA family protein [Methanomethylovorans sp.]|jgi:TldD protein|nr:TldD/PmbA family protein [Methanomethylovorans sp.]